MLLNIVKKVIKYLINKVYREPKHLAFQVYCTLSKKVVLHEYAAIPLRIYISNYVSKIWYDHNETRNEIKFLQKHRLKEGARIFNIGAHEGVIALIFSKIVGRNGSVVAVEMDKSHIKIANINRKNNNVSNLAIINAAAGEKNGVTTFDKDQVSTKNQSMKKSIKVLTIDNLTKKFGIPDLIYIDVEGYEENVLKGARKTLGFYPDLFIEVHVNYGLEKFKGSVQNIVSFFPLDKYNLLVSPPVDKCLFKPFSFKSKIIHDRFYLIALRKDK